MATEQSRGRGVEEVIRDRVAATGADLLVLGPTATHGWQLVLFSGATRRPAHHAVPSFMSQPDRD